MLRKRRIRNYVVLVVLLIVSAAWCVSLVADLSYATVSKFAASSINVKDGCISYTRMEFASQLDPTVCAFIFHHNFSNRSVFFNGLTRQPKWLPEVSNAALNWPSSHSRWPYRRFHCILPLWMPFAVFLTLGAVLWTNRKRRLDHCESCDYNLTGNESGKCPECSTPVPKREATA